MSDSLGIALNSLFYVILNTLVISQNLINKEKISFRLNTIRSLPDVNFGKMAVDLSDIVKE